MNYLQAYSRGSDYNYKLTFNPKIDNTHMKSRDGDCIQLCFHNTLNCMLGNNSSYSNGMYSLSVTKILEFMLRNVNWAILSGCCLIRNGMETIIFNVLAV